MTEKHKGEILNRALRDQERLLQEGIPNLSHQGNNNPQETIPFPVGTDSYFLQ